MDVIVRSNNNPVNDMTASVSGLINDLDRVIKTKSTQSLFGSDCNGLSKWIFISPARQTNPGWLLRNRED